MKIDSFSGDRPLARWFCRLIGNRLVDQRAHQLAQAQPGRAGAGRHEHDRQIFDRVTGVAEDALVALVVPGVDVVQLDRDRDALGRLVSERRISRKPLIHLADEI